MAGLDISEKRLPQDGRIHFKDRQRDVDLRVNTLPTVYGEKTVMRILDRTAKAIELSKIGLKGNNQEWLLEGVNQPHGMVLVTGPTGSGKTTTLYSVLDEIVTPEINVSTVENPVERSVEGVNQTQVNAKSGLSFALCLRALLRQDPDVIMIGEIRDRETAMIAVEAAQTGHLVLATLHTNDAPGAATRLIQMGVEPFLVASTLRTVMAQRLVRKLCDACKRPHELPANVLRRYAPEGLKTEGPWYASAGCPACRNTGYDGRRAVFEVMRVDSALQDLIGNNPSSADVRALALKSGMTSLLADALDRVNVGITSLEEAIRAAGTMH
jgi:type II secretory ATPase GspE/PulE/Tfp pilus assembly ATPase PilB-like protein